MCGITGIISKNKEKINIDELRRFNESLIHRGPDDTNIYINSSAEVGLGHRRLSIIDLSKLGSQPMKLDDRFTITFNGEIYNFIELKKDLELLGHKFKSNSDTEVLLRSYIEWGEECQKKLNGDWAFAIWDKSKNKIFISRDRYGVKPLYYLNLKDKFYFASELKSFMKIEKKNVPGFDENIIINLAKYNSNNSYIFGEETFLKNVKELPAGHQLTIENESKINLLKWWKTIENIKDLKNEKFLIKDKFSEIFTDACKIRMISDVKIGTSLSGGLDSSSVLSKLKSINDKGLDENSNYISKGFFYDYMDDDVEKKNVLENIKNLGLETEIIKFDRPENLNDKLKNIIFYQEEITGNDGYGPWSIFEKMKENNIKVSIDGHGADELLGGYKGYLKYSIQDTNILLEFNLLVSLFKNFLILKNDLDENSSLPKLIIEKIKIYLINKFKRKTNFMDKNFFTKDAAKRKIFEFDEINSLSNLNKYLYLEYHYKSLSLTLKKFDKFSMAHGVEMRSPFLDHRLVNFSFSLSNQYKIDGKYTKKILRDVMRNQLPEKIINQKRKTNFTPTNVFFNNEYRKFVLDTVSENNFQNESIWNGKKLKNYVETSNNIRNIYKYIQIYLIKKTFKEFSNIN